MPRLKIDRIYLAAAALVPMALDFLVTLLGQHPSYWAGHQWVTESNPVWAELLLVHPAAFVAGVLLYAIVFAAGIYFCPRWIAWWLSIVLLVTHTSGVNSWLWRFTTQVTIAEVVVNGVLGLLATWCYLSASRRDNRFPTTAGTVATEESGERLPQDETIMQGRKGVP